MKTKLKKHGVKILTMIICVLSLVTALVIVPSADTYDDNFTHYWFYLNSSDDVTVPSDGVSQITIKVRSDKASKIGYIYARQNDRNLFDFLYFKNYDLSFTIAKGVSFDNEPYLSTTLDISSTDPWQGSQYNHQRLIINKSYNSNGECVGMHVQSVLLNHTVDLEWLPQYGNYNLQLWFDLNTIQDVFVKASTDLKYVYLADVVRANCRYSVESTPKTYTQGYNNGYIAGSDFGYEQGYGDGFDQGNIEGIQQGLTEGYNEGYSIGNEEGYSDGYDYGYLDGEKYGWDNGFGAGQNDMAKTNETFKDMVFAIFDAPSVLIDGMLNFNIFGINLAGLVKTIITLAVVAVIVFAILKFTKG